MMIAAAILVGVAMAVPAASFGVPLPNVDVPSGPATPVGTACGSDPAAELLAQSGAADFTEEVDAGTWATWVSDVADVVVDAPPAVGSLDHALELAEVKLATLQRTADESLQAEILGTGPAAVWWQELYLDLIVEHAGKTGKRNPPALSREMAILNTAIYDALVITWNAKYCYNKPGPAFFDPTMDTIGDAPAAPSYPSEHAAVTGVADVIFRYLFPCDDPIGDPEHCEEHPSYFDTATGNFTESRIRAGLNYRSDIEAGLAIGRAVGQAVLDARENDGWNATSTRVPITGPCNWKPTAPAYRPTPLVPQWGDVTPWIMSSGSEFRPGPPPACDGPQYIGQYVDVFEMSLTATDRMLEVADYWEAGQGTVTPPGMSLEIALEKVAEHDLNSLRAARVLAAVSVGEADAAIAAWDTKFTYWWDRPITAIRRLNLDTDAGLCTDGEDTHPLNPYGGCWMSHAATPPFPGYISGHSTFTGAGMMTLKYFFPEDWPELRGYSTEAANARFYGGIHFRADNDVGIEVGFNIGEKIHAHLAGDGADD